MATTKRMIKWGIGVTITGLSSLIIPILIVVAIVFVVIGDYSTSQSQYEDGGYNSAVPDGLTEFSYFCFYESGGEGLYNAVLGDGGRAFGAYQYDYAYELQPFLAYCVAQNPNKYMAFERFLSVPKSSLLGSGSLASTWRQVYAADSEGFSRMQDQYAKEEKYMKVEEFLQGHGIDLSGRPDVVKGLVLSIHNRKGMETHAKYSYVLKSGVGNNTSDADFIRILCDTFGTRGGNIYKRYCVDYSGPACGTICEKNMALAILNGRSKRPGGSSGNVDVDGTGMSYEQKMAFLFPGGVPQSESQMGQYLTTVSVPVVNINGTQSTASLTVHRALANDIVGIYTDIANSGFPIKDTYAYSWRSMAASGSRSHHSYGVAIDINWNENYMIKNGSVIAGSLWQPGSNPYSIPVDSAVTRAFAKRGWIWGGDWTSSKDYMHFSFTGR